MRENYEGVNVLDTDPFKHYLWEIVMNGGADEFAGSADFHGLTVDRLGRHVLICNASGHLEHVKMHGHKWEHHFHMWLEDYFGEGEAFRLTQLHQDWQYDDYYFPMNEGETVAQAVARRDLESPDSAHVYYYDARTGTTTFYYDDGSVIASL